MTKRILIVGGGAIGAFYGSLLARVAEVAFVLRSNYSIVAKDGFIMKTKSFGDYHYKPVELYKSISDVRQKQAKPFDFIIIAIKAIPSGQMSVARQLKEHFPSLSNSSTSILLIQNGIGGEETFRCIFHDQKPLLDHVPSILSSVTRAAASQISPGVIRQFQWTHIDIGPYFKDPILEGLQDVQVGNAVASYRPNQNSNPGHDDEERALNSAREITHLLLQSGVKDAIAVESHRQMQIIRWHKLWINGAFNPTSVVAGGRFNADMAKDPYLRQHLIGCIEEISSIANKLYGISMPEPGFPKLDQLLASIERSTGNRSSMLQDWESGNAIESDVLLKYPLLIGERLGVSTPRLHALYSLLQSLQYMRKQTSTAPKSNM